MWYRTKKETKVYRKEDIISLQMILNKRPLTDKKCEMYPYLLHLFPKEGETITGNDIL